MKRLTLHLTFLAVVAAHSSCTNLEEKPIGLLAPESFFKSPGDVEAAIMGAYAEYAAVAIYSNTFAMTIMVRSDMVDIGDRNTSADRIQVNEFSIDPSNNNISEAWDAFYRSISAANTAIQGAKSINADEKIKKKLEAEARFIRAHSYFQLVRMHGAVPYLDRPVESAAALDSASRTPANVIYNHIEADLKFAKENLPDQQPGGVRNRATSGSAATELVDVYLTLKMFDKAAQESRYVIGKAGAYGYELEKNYQDLFNGDLANRLREPIFNIDWQNGFTDYPYQADWLAVHTRIKDYKPRSTSIVVPSLAVYNSWDGRDYRKRVSFEDSVVINGKLTALTDTKFTAPRPHIAKYFRYPGPQEAGNDRRTDNDYHIYRYADLLLMAAEAIAESEGAKAEAIGYVNQVRKRARFNGKTETKFPADIPATVGKTELIQIIREERRLELAFEMKRWFDIQRWGILKEVFEGANSLEPHKVDPARDYLFPIPQTEIDVTRFKQNPGY
ncbi:RagB/SusD family nutrient uptake outer membrane protein [Persicitalea jodogahamensis]|nr:RagB/SusD family nutrient uptake outer membrane protein [Persicitalea jodogahamensis]